jgi:TrmH family RNA methyltransferase
MPEPHFDCPPCSENLAKKLRALKQKKYRDIEKTFLVEGLRLNEEAVAAGADIVHVVVTKEALEQPRVAALIRTMQSKNSPVFIAPQRLFQSLSDEISPQGLLCAVRKTKPKSAEHISASLILACDNIQDPGNLGTIFRSAEWFGVTDILLSPGCVDPYNPKVVRGSMGAVFRLSIFEQIDLVQSLPMFKERGYRIVGTVLDAPKKLNELRPQKDILLIGNEANGLSTHVASLIDEAITIPGAGNGESLNAAIAASICLYHLSQTWEIVWNS